MAENSIIKELFNIPEEQATGDNTDANNISMNDILEIIQDTEIQDKEFMLKQDDNICEQYCYGTEYFYRSRIKRCN